MIILDTNVVSEVTRIEPDPSVLRWIDAAPRPLLFTTVITEMEMRLGAELLPRGRRRDALRDRVRGTFEEDLAGHVLPFDSPAAAAYAEIVAARRDAGRPISQSDAQIAAIARSRDATLATRKVRDFEGCGIELVDPWAS